MYIQNGGKAATINITRNPLALFTQHALRLQADHATFCVTGSWNLVTGRIARSASRRYL